MEIFDRDVEVSLRIATDATKCVAGYRGVSRSLSAAALIGRLIRGLEVTRQVGVNELR